MANGKDIRAGRAFVELYADSTKLNSALKSLEGKFSAFGDVVAGWGKKMMGIGLAILTPLALAAKGFADYGSKMHDLSQQTGISAEALSAMGYAAEQAGSSLESFVGAVGKMQMHLADAGGVTAEVQQALLRLGITIQQLQGLSPDDQFKKIADGISKLQPASARTSVAMAIFGKSGAALIPMMADGAEGLDKMRKRAEELGIVMSGAAANAADELGDAVADMSLSIKGAWLSLGMAAAPAILTVINAVTDAVVVVRKFIEEHRELVVRAMTVAAAITVAGAALFGFGKTITYAMAAIKGLWAAIMGVKVVLGATFGALATIVSSPMLLATAAVVALGAAFVYQAGYMGKVTEWLSGRFGALRDFAIDAFGGIADALTAGDIALAAKILWKTLEIAWRTGTNTLDAIWLTVQQKFVEVFEGTVSAMEAAWEIATNFLTTSFVHAMSIISQTFAVTVGILKGLWIEFSSWFQKGINALSGYFAKLMIGMNGRADQRQMMDEIDKETAMRGQNITQDTSAQHAANRTDLKSQVDQLESDKRKQLNMQAKDHEARMTEIGDTYNRKIAEIEANFAKEIAAGGKDLAKLWEEFAALVAKAKLERQMRENSIAASSAPAAGVGSILAKSRTFGSFSSAAANVGSAISTDKELAEIKKHTAKTAKNTENMANSLFNIRSPYGTSYGR